MKLSEVAPLRTFALLGPGFSPSRRFTLVTDLVADPTAPRVVFAPYEAAADAWQHFDGNVHALETLELDVPPQPLEPLLDERGHADAVHAIRALIASGDVYQVNFTLRARLADVPGASVFSRLCQRGVPAFAAWARFPDGTEIVSASPELLFEISGDVVRSEPMKGTAPPHARAALEQSTKDRAELAMITDLVRNDLTPLCVPRSVRVVNDRRIIELPYALQTVSDVHGTLLPKATPLDVLAALHPPGSVTGAPKNAARDIITTLETAPRGAYCGALGFIHGADAAFSVLIRTAQRTPGGWVYGVGGGIVWDSDAAAELEESRLKLGALS